MKIYINKLQSLIYYFLWRLLHSLFKILYMIRQRWSLMVIRMRYSSMGVTKHVKVNNNLNLTKLPKHVSIVINEDDVHFDSLSNMVLWCKQLNIPYITLYIDSDLMKNGHNLNLKGSKRLVQTNGTKINVLTSNGRDDLLLVSRKLAANEMSTIDNDLISDTLRENNDFPDPELLISFGSSPTVCGYPPWQLRLTEIYFHNTHRHFEKCKFLETLNMYSKTEQRYGR